MIFTNSSSSSSSSLSDSSSSFENTNLTNHSSNELESLQVSRFPSDLVHKHIIYIFNPFTSEKNDDYPSRQYIIMQAMLYVKTGNSGPEILHNSFVKPFYFLQN